MMMKRPGLDILARGWRTRAAPLVRRLLTIAIGVCLAPLSVWAENAGPSQVAKADYRLWPEQLNTVAAFDKASRASLLVYVAELQAMRQFNDAEMLNAFKIKSINRASVENWVGKELRLSLLNYQRAAVGCTAADWTCLDSAATLEEFVGKVAVGRSRVPSGLQNWHENLAKFIRTYLAEQLRLAALFPKISSEIDLFNPMEFNGDLLEDRQFFLSFDDGPTAPNGTTDETLRLLTVRGKSAVFFVLGQNLKTRSDKTSPAAVTNLYQNQCVGSHGWEHQSHAKWEQWQDSIKRTQALLHIAIAKPSVVPLFRPPYGQRKADSGAFFQSQSLQVALWNLDSQDWNSQVDAADITSRIITLMLVKRHGVLLFHDVHSKAKGALPVIFDAVGNAVNWGDCHQLALSK